ncbi:EF-hand domain-containing protein [Solemya velum gill symbiont]|uniref:EF-hand domain-containing protein n=1 Tax=Solemya velum gill symbiont TaxID=2340 RepID=A0A1T2FIJ2_SOVGS|nr:EF-hand domain-containing protein [Solemya velum gill symbiont]OOY34158.1 hypothetical protein BOV88_11700 [Solemya velum gill symbiont]OOY36856.1 hypothetical protein BOV89_10610 [Solemya velum gill symbiont]OOY39996.1 hypothetical protein BOV90_06295 [Solemya velum gill symbiont]OOY44807.1 hypothetical protein BOV92_07860 [Solemya velum gill symbiont]OOY46448.1 hypothetical protein BOV93_10275 [Solemya velum gill symbiont]
MKADIFQFFVAILLAAVSLLFYSSSTVVAQTEAQLSDNRVFSVHDQDRDGFLDQKEYEHFYMQMVQRREASGRSHRHMPLFLFEEIDYNRNGLIEEEEMASAMNARLRKHRRYRYRGRR